MRKLEYVLSVALALSVLGGMVAWMQASEGGSATALSCKAGRVSTPVVLKGMSVYPKCPAGKRG